MNKDLLTVKSHQYIMCSNVMIKDLIESWLIRHDRAFKNQYRPDLSMKSDAQPE